MTDVQEIQGDSTGCLGWAPHTCVEQGWQNWTEGGKLPSMGWGDVPNRHQ